MLHSMVRNLTIRFEWNPELYMCIWPLYLAPVQGWDVAGYLQVDVNHSGAIPLQVHLGKI